MISLSLEEGLKYAIINWNEKLKQSNIDYTLALSMDIKSNAKPVLSSNLDRGLKYELTCSLDKIVHGKVEEKIYTVKIPLDEKVQNSSDVEARQIMHYKAECQAYMVMLMEVFGSYSMIKMQANKTMVPPKAKMDVVGKMVAKKVIADKENKVIDMKHIKVSSKGKKN